MAANDVKCDEVVVNASEESEHNLTKDRDINSANNDSLPLKSVNSETASNACKADDSQSTHENQLAIDRNCALVVNDIEISGGHVEQSVDHSEPTRADNTANSDRNNSNIDDNIDDNGDADQPFDESKSSSDSDDEDSILNHDPTPSSAYPSIKWYSLQQLCQREYGMLFRPGNKRSFNSYDSQWFRRYAYNSLFFFQRLELMEKFEEHNGCVNCLNFNSSGDLLCSGSDDLRIAVWDWQKSRVKHIYHSGHTSNVFQCRWCLDGHHIVSCARDGQVRITNLSRSSTTVSNKLAQHKSAAHKLTLTSPQVVLSCGEDACVFEIDLRADKPTKLLIVKNSNEQRVPLYSINCNMAFNPLHFVVSGRDPNVLIYDRRFLPRNDNSTVSPVLSLCPPHLQQSKHSVTCAQYNSTADTVLSTYNDEDIYTFNAKTGSVDSVYRGHRNSATVKGCSWFGDDFIVSGSDDGYVYGWDRVSQHIVMSLYADENGVVNCIEPHPTAPIIATSGLDDNVKIWVPSADQWPQTLKGIKQRICSNMKARKQSHKRLAEFEDEDGIDSSMFYLILRHMRRQRLRSERRRTENPSNNEENGEENDDNEDDDSESNSDDDHVQQQCVQS